MEGIDGGGTGFLVMPFMHSESLWIHDWAANGFDEPGLERRKNMEMAHRAIIEQFGRYPIRNQILGKSTIEEEQFLENIRIFKRKHNKRNNTFLLCFSC